MRGTWRIDIVIVFPEHHDETICPLLKTISTSDLLFSYIQEEMVEPLFDEALVSKSTFAFVEATNITITDEATVVRE